MASKTISQEKTDEIIGGMKEFRNRETNIYKALNSEKNEYNIKPRKYDEAIDEAIDEKKDDEKKDEILEGVVDMSVLLKEEE
jgi:hypothetical protein